MPQHDADNLNPRRQAWWRRVAGLRFPVIATLLAVGVTALATWQWTGYRQANQAGSAAATAASTVTAPSQFGVKAAAEESAAYGVDATAAASAQQPVPMLESPGAPTPGTSTQNSGGAIRYGVRIEGHDIPNDAAYVLKVLESAGQLETRTMPLETTGVARRPETSAARRRAR